MRFKLSQNIRSLMSSDGNHWVFVMPVGQVYDEDLEVTHDWNAEFVQHVAEQNQALFAELDEIAAETNSTPWRPPIKSEHHPLSPSLGRVEEVRFGEFMPGKLGNWARIKWRDEVRAAVENGAHEYLSIGLFGKFPTQRGSVYGPVFGEISVTGWPKAQSLGTLQETLHIRLSNTLAPFRGRLSKLTGDTKMALTKDDQEQISEMFTAGITEALGPVITGMEAMGERLDSIETKLATEPADEPAEEPAEEPTEEPAEPADEQTEEPAEPVDDAPLDVAAANQMIATAVTAAMGPVLSRLDALANANFSRQSTPGHPQPPAPKKSPDEIIEEALKAGKTEEEALRLSFEAGY